MKLQKPVNDVKFYVETYKGLCYDVTRKFNVLKEKKRKKDKNVNLSYAEGIINPNIDTELVQTTYILEEKLSDLIQIRDELNQHAGEYERKAFDNDSIKDDVNKLNYRASTIINEVEDDLLRMLREEERDKLRDDVNRVQAQTKKNGRTNLSLRLNDLTKEIKDINMRFLFRTDKYKKLEQDSWYNKTLYDEEFQQIMADKIIEEEKEIDNIAQRRDQDINSIVIAIERLTEQFRKMQLLVIQQGSMVDRIDYNLEQAETNAGKGKLQLKQANDRAESCTCVAKVLYCEIISIIILTVMLFLKFRNTSGVHVIRDNDDYHYETQ